jgi:glycerol-3-phosphate O-acyltransferase
MDPRQSAGGGASRAARCGKNSAPVRGRRPRGFCYSQQDVRPDDIRRAVLEREDVARYLASQGSVPEARERIESFLDELRTTQRYRFYRALQHPLYPILRKVRRVAEHLEHAREALGRGRVVYVSNHKSHLDYLVEPLVLDDNGIRPPLTAAGINLFGGALGLLHKHVTGAVPIRRNSKDPLYLITLRAYIAELLKSRDLLYYAEGGRSYSGELKAPKTGLLQAALAADRHELSIVPMAIAYDLVLEDRILSREATRRRKRPFAQEVAEMVRHAVGYESRAFVTFARPIPLGPFDPESRRDLVTLAHRVQDEIGRQHKVLPTALVASVMRPRLARAELVARLDERLGALADAGANLAVRSGRQAVDEGVALIAGRDILVDEGHLIRVRDRVALRYYARSIEHLLGPGRPHRTTH